MFVVCTHLCAHGLGCNLVYYYKYNTCKVPSNKIANASTVEQEIANASTVEQEKG